MAVFILAVIVNSYNTGQVRAGSPQLASPQPPDGACFPSLLSAHLRVSRGQTRVRSLPARSFSVGEDGEPPPLPCSLQLFFCFFICLFSSPLSAFSQYYINMTNHKSHMCS